jgi:hypothetical protein
MQSNQRISFHESSVVGFRRLAGTVILELEGVHVDDNLRTASIRLMDIRAIARDGIPGDDLTPECEDGEVLTLEHTPNSLYLIVEWNDFKRLI